MRRRFIVLALLVAAVASSVAAASTKDVRLSLVAYSTPREAYNQLIPDFQKTQPGNGVGFSQSYAASGDQTRAVKAGLKADIVALSLAPDVDELVTAGLVDAAATDEATAATRSARTMNLRRMSILSSLSTGLIEIGSSNDSNKICQFTTAAARIARCGRRAAGCSWWAAASPAAMSRGC